MCNKKEQSSGRFCTCVQTTFVISESIVAHNVHTAGNFNSNLYEQFVFLSACYIRAFRRDVASLDNDCSSFIITHVRAQRLYVAAISLLLSIAILVTRNAPRGGWRLCLKFAHNRWSAPCRSSCLMSCPRSSLLGNHGEQP